jgi:regulatory protein
MMDADEDPPKKPRRREATPSQRALALLVRREHSRKELTRKLLVRGISGEDADAAVQRMAKSGWQDDTRFACSLARTRAIAGYGPLHIRAELATHNLGHQAIEAAFDALAKAGEDDWRSRAKELVERRFDLDAGSTLATQRKAADFLARRGFDGDTVRAVLRGLPDD